MLNKQYKLAISGKMGSGKDTVRQLVQERLGGEWRQLAVGGATRIDAARRMVRCDAGSFRPSFGYDTADGKVTGMQVGDPRPDGGVLIAHAPAPCGCGRCDNRWSARPIVGLDEEFREEGGREVLQWIALDRRLEQADYWTSLMMEQAAVYWDNGYSVGWADVREIDEVEAAQRHGFYTVRLDVSESTQRERLLHRDGSLPPLRAFEHPNEKHLDTYEQFDIRVNAEGPLDEIVDKVVVGIVAKHQ